MQQPFRIAVTGSSGFVGGHTVRRLLAEGYIVRCLIRENSGSSSQLLKRLFAAPVEIQNLEWATIDYKDETSLETALVNVDWVVHLGGQINGRTFEDFISGNAFPTHQLAHIVANMEKPPKFLLVSSLAAAGPATAADKPRQEFEEPQPISWYGRSKMAAENVLRGHRKNFMAVIMRPPIIYGPGDLALAGVAKAIARSRFFPLPGGLQFSQSISLIYIDDFVAALICLIKNGDRLNSGAIFHLESEDRSGPDYLTSRDLMEAMATALKRPLPRWIPLPFIFLKALQPILQWALGAKTPLTADKVRELQAAFWTSKTGALATLGWKPKILLKKGMETTVDDYQSRGWL